MKTSFEASFIEQDKKYELPSGLLKKIYDTEEDYLKQASRSISRREIMNLIIESVPKDGEGLEKLLKERINVAD